jgi:hypothetical protein
MSFRRIETGASIGVISFARADHEGGQLKASILIRLGKPEPCM